MFATVRAKLIGFSFISLCFILLVGAAGYYEKSASNDSIAYTQRNLETMNSQMRPGSGDRTGACRCAAGLARCKNRRYGPL